MSQPLSLALWPEIVRSPHLYQLLFLTRALNRVSSYTGGENSNYCSADAVSKSKKRAAALMVRGRDSFFWQLQDLQGIWDRQGWVPAFRFLTLIPVSKPCPLSLEVKKFVMSFAEKQTNKQTTPPPPTWNFCFSLGLMHQHKVEHFSDLRRRKMRKIPLALLRQKDINRNGKTGVWLGQAQSRHLHNLRNSCRYSGGEKQNPGANKGKSTVFCSSTCFSFAFLPEKNILVFLLSSVGMEEK